MDCPANPFRQPFSRMSFLALALVLGAGCGGDAGGPTDPESGSINIDLSPTSVGLVQGETGTTTVTLTRSGSFSGAVDLSLEGLPGGVTGTFSTAKIAAAANGSTLSLATTAAAAPGTYTITVRAQASGVSDQTKELALVVTAAPSPDFEVVPERGMIGIIQGREASAGVSIKRLGGFDGQVTLSLEGAPAGMTATLAGNDEVRLSLGRHMHVGDHKLTVRGVSGSLTRTAELIVRVFQSRPVAAGWSHSLAVASDGSLWSWGKNEKGQLGLGHTTDQNAPVRVGTDTNWVAVAGGSDHSIALRSDGSLWVAGSNGYGQLGIAGSQQLTLQRVGTDNDWVAIAVGDDHTMAIKADRSLWVWGQNRSGQLGTGNTPQHNAPFRLAGDGWVQVAGGSQHTVAVKTDGSLWAWGYNSYGQLGSGTKDNEPLPRRVGTGNDWLLASAGVAGGATLAVKTDGTLWGWGRNISGELGLGIGAQALSPQQVGTAKDWLDVSMGGGFSIALETDGTLWSSGVNSAGQLGIAEVENRYEFIQALGTGWQFVATGEAHTLAIGPDGGLFAWGANQFGKLGHGTSDTKGNGPVPGFNARWP